jgi:hypothetical protein
MSDVIWLDDIPIESTPSDGLPSDWVVGRFEKRHGCRTPGQCDEDCDCGCPYKEMSEADTLPLIEAITTHFPNEWLAFIVPPEEDDDLMPVHGKLVAHSPNLDDVHDAILTVLWNQCVYVFYNGDVESQQASL